MTIWICGELFEPGKGARNSWVVNGAFDTEAAAVARCTNPRCFVGPLTLNESLPDAVIDWEGWYYPSETEMPRP